VTLRCNLRLNMYSIPRPLFLDRAKDAGATSVGHAGVKPECGGGRGGGGGVAGGGGVMGEKGGRGGKPYS